MQIIKEKIQIFDGNDVVPEGLEKVSSEFPFLIAFHS